MYKEELDPRFFQLIMDWLDGVAITDAQGRYLYANENWMQYMGCDLSEIKGKYVHDYFPFSKVDEVLRTGQEYRSIPISVQNWGKVPGFCSYYPIKEKDRILGVFVHAVPGIMQKGICLPEEYCAMVSSLEQCRQELLQLRNKRFTLDAIVGISKETMRLKEDIMKAVQTDASVWIEGEDGTEKELAAVLFIA